MRVIALAVLALSVMMRPSVARAEGTCSSEDMELSFSFGAASLWGPMGHSGSVEIRITQSGALLEMIASDPYYFVKNPQETTRLNRTLLQLDIFEDAYVTYHGHYPHLVGSLLFKTQQFKNTLETVKELYQRRLERDSSRPDERVIDCAIKIVSDQIRELKLARP